VFSSSRCAVIGDGFYEWTGTKGSARKPYFFHCPDDGLDPHGLRGGNASARVLICRTFRAPRLRGIPQTIGLIRRPESASLSRTSACCVGANCCSAARGALSRLRAPRAVHDKPIQGRV
jgi:hypothetical protein